MHARTWIPLIVVTLIIVLLGGFLVTTNQQILIITDSSYYGSQLDANTRFKLRVALITKRYSLRIWNLPPEQLRDKERFSSELQERLSERVTHVVTSPIVSALVSNDAEFWQKEFSTNQARDLTTVSIATGNTDLFDVNISYSFEDEGWAIAAQQLSTAAHDQVLPTVLLYEESDVQSAAHAQLFASNFTGGVLDIKAVHKPTKKEIEQLIEDIADSGALYIVIPYVENLATYVTAARDYQLRWIVDAQYAQVVDSQLREGVVADDLIATVISLIEQERLSSITMVRTYHPTKRAWQNLL